MEDQQNVKIHKFNENLKFDITGNMKGEFYFKNVQVSFNVLDEGMMDLVIIQMQETKKKFEKAGYMWRTDKKDANITQSEVHEE